MKEKLNGQRQVITFDDASPPKNGGRVKRVATAFAIGFLPGGLIALGVMFALKKYYTHKRKAECVSGTGT